MGWRDHADHGGMERPWWDGEALIGLHLRGVLGYTVTLD